MKPYIVQFSNTVNNDFHGSWKLKFDFSLRFSSIQTANKAAEIWTRNQPKKPYVKEATVFDGPLIVCPVHTSYIAQMPGYQLNPHLNYIFVNNCNNK